MQNKERNIKMAIREIGKLLNSKLYINQCLSLPVPLPVNNKIMDCFFMFDFQETMNTVDMYNLYRMFLHYGDSYSLINSNLIKKDDSVHIQGKRKYFKPFTQEKFDRYLELYDKIKDALFSDNALDAETKQNVVEFYDLLNELAGDQLMKYYKTLFSETISKLKEVKDGK
jgi:hypothetical protein